MTRIHRDGIISAPVENHAGMKSVLLESIASMGVHSAIKVGGPRISNTDWHLSRETARPYVDIIAPMVLQHVQKIKEAFKYPYGMFVHNYWFQQYNKGDFHGWHTHAECNFSNVYYVDLPEGSAKTTFKYGDTQFEVDVEEGQILTFPAYLAHCSKASTQDKVKTVVVFNSSWNND